MSDRGLANIRAAQQARRARERGEPGAEDAAAKPRRKRRLSALGLANIRAGVVKREARKAGAAVGPAAMGAPAPATKTKKRLSEAKLQALVKARAARLAKRKAAKKQA